MSEINPNALKAFQNISCYCLTASYSIDNEFFSEFQNISCYCLTTTDTLFINRF